jgi:hypothetical protein
VFNNLEDDDDDVLVRNPIDSIVENSDDIQFEDNEGEEGSFSLEIPQPLTANYLQVIQDKLDRELNRHSFEAFNPVQDTAKSSNNKSPNLMQRLSGLPFNVQECFWHVNKIRHSLRGSVFGPLGE